jgi:hypothetical protein
MLLWLGILPLFFNNELLEMLETRERSRSAAAAGGDGKGHFATACAFVMRAK